MIKIAATLMLVCLYVTLVNAENEQWKQFKLKFGKAYANADHEQKRLKIFQENLALIEAHNLNHKNGQVTFTMGVNKFSDMTNEEYRKLLTAKKELNITSTARHLTKAHQATGAQSSLPNSIDWRDKNAVTSVKDQGQCGSCWAFSAFISPPLYNDCRRAQVVGADVNSDSLGDPENRGRATGSLEGQNAIVNGELLSFSEQQQIDCCGKEYGNDGCNGGMTEESFVCLYDIEGLQLESDYPYLDKDKTIQGRTCRFNPEKAAVTIWAVYEIENKNENSLQYAVANVGPVSVTIDASWLSFQSYSGGVYNEPKCSQTHFNHAVLVVGYGVENGNDYWLVKNSWGTAWGEDGYIKMTRGSLNQCGIANYATYPYVY